MNKRKLLERVRNNPQDVRFSDLEMLVEGFGYRLHRTDGSHRVYIHPKAPLHLNLQPDRHGKAKEYQVRQFLRDTAAYGLQMEDEA